MKLIGKSGSHNCSLIVNLLCVAFLVSQVHGIPYIYEWSSTLFEFVLNSSLAQKFVIGEEPVTTPKLIEAQGYPVEIHKVTTEDGYILEMHRIPHGIHPRRNDTEPRLPVMVFHGNSQSSADWVVNTPHEDALGFYLADSGYDVWLVNQRGNMYSTMTNGSLSWSHSRFWNYTFDEIGRYDIPAMIDYITIHTGQPKVHFIGFSMTNAALLILLSVKPEYNTKVGVAILLAPSVYFRGFLYGLARGVAPLAYFYDVLSRIFGDIPIVPPLLSNILRRITPVLCHPAVDRLGLCVIFFHIAFGDDKGLITQDKISLITSVAPSPFSMKLIMHGMQQVDTGGFHEYDYGISKNLQVYGTRRPPSYNLTNVQIPVALIVGGADFLASPTDAEVLAKGLPNVVELHYVDNPYFRHLDFCYSKGVGELVYSRVVKLMDSYPNYDKQKTLTLNAKNNPNLTSYMQR